MRLNPYLCCKRHAVSLRASSVPSVPAQGPGSRISCPRSSVAAPATPQQGWSPASHGPTLLNYGPTSQPILSLSPSHPQGGAWYPALPWCSLAALPLDGLRQVLDDRPCSAPPYKVPSASGDPETHQSWGGGDWKGGMILLGMSSMQDKSTESDRTFQAIFMYDPKRKIDNFLTFTSNFHNWIDREIFSIFLKRTGTSRKFSIPLKNYMPKKRTNVGLLSF